jgi:hypothetical protein
VSGFVVDTAAPDEDDQLPSGDYVYFKVRFLDRQGIGHDYWLQIDALGSNKTISIVITNDLVSDPNDLIAAENIPYPADSFISDGMIRVGDQWIAQIPVEDEKGRGALRGMEVPEYKQILSELMNALEGNGEFPANIPGFFVPAESLIVRK